MVDAEGQLDEGAGLSEKDVRIDARKRCLPQLGDGRLLAVAGLDLGAQMGDFRDAFRTAAGDEVERLFWIRSGRLYVDQLK